MVSGKRLSLPLGVETHDAGSSGQPTLKVSHYSRLLIILVRSHLFLI